MSRWKQKRVYDFIIRTIIERSCGEDVVISVVIIDQIRKKERNEAERARPMLRIEPEHPSPQEPPSIHESCSEESNRGIAIIDFSI